MKILAEISIFRFWGFRCESSKFRAHLGKTFGSVSVKCFEKCGKIAMPLSHLPAQSVLQRMRLESPV